MARKERNDVDYFPHSVNHGKKMFYLRDKFNNDGYAVWFMLLEHLSKAQYHFLDLKDEIEIMYLSSEFKVTEELLINIIEALVKFKEFDRELWNDHKILFNEKFIDNISDAYKKRNNDCINRNSLILLLESKGRLKPSLGNPNTLKSIPEVGSNPHTILKDSKVNNTIVKKTKEVRLEEFKNSLKKYSDNYKGEDKVKNTYPPEMVRSFFEYWTEIGEKDKKFKFEKQKTFGIAVRLSRWNSNNFGSSKILKVGAKTASEELLEKLKDSQNGG